MSDAAEIVRELERNLQCLVLTIERKHEATIQSQASRLLELSMAQDAHINYTASVLEAAKKWRAACASLIVLVAAGRQANLSDAEILAKVVEALDGLEKEIRAAVDVIPAGFVEEPDVGEPDDEED